MTPAQWEAQFITQPDELGGYTMISCLHPVHECKRFYLSVEQWQDCLVPLLTPYWINGYTVTMISCD